MSKNILAMCIVGQPVVLLANHLNYIGIGVAVALSGFLGAGIGLIKGKGAA